MKIDNSQIRLMSDYMVINGIGNPASGFIDGKAGISLILYEVARELNDERYEEYGFTLLKESLLVKNEFVDFDNGITGVGYVLIYLINNGFIESDFDEVFADKHKYILEKILNNNFEFGYLEAFYFIGYYKMKGVVINDVESSFRYVFEQLKIDNKLFKIDKNELCSFSKFFLDEYHQNLSQNNSVEHAIISTMKCDYLISNIRKVKIVLLDLLLRKNRSLSRINELLMIS